MSGYERVETMVLKFSSKEDYDKFFNAFMDEVPICGAQILTLAKGDVVEDLHKVRCDLECETCAEAIQHE